MEDLIAGVKEIMKNNDVTAAAAKIKEYLEKERNTPLNIAITGESGAGKSSFVNAFRGITDEDDERAAPTGVTETTSEVTAYPHQNYPNVTLWDLPGIGTTKFPAKEYLELVGFEKFDFFIIISDTRFRENDVKLAQEIQRMEKKFYFVRSKIDNDINAERRKRDFSKEGVLTKIKENCIHGLTQLGIKSPQVFLVSTFELHLCDFYLLHETLERDLDELKKYALLSAMPNIDLEIISKKKEAFKHRIPLFATLCAAGAAVPFPGLSSDTDLAVLAVAVKDYVLGFGLDIPSLKRLSSSTGVPYNDLCAVINSPLAAAEITSELLLKVIIAQSSDTTELTTAEEVFTLIPIIGMPVAMGISFTRIYKFLNVNLSQLTEDARRVFRRAVGINTSV
ncbi:interferon-inducible GTPase 5-like [Pelmatolapia mariae]|uniref:interferon-inducible GTPase 5-like n=1 Tax=Pelmatolapia mariae TaxID=158779 RepID=UPI002FE62156